MTWIKCHSGNIVHILIVFIFIQAGETHIYKKYYPGTEVERLFVEKDKMPWKVPFPEYQPTNYTVECTTICDQNDTEGIKFNAKENDIDRRSWTGKYEVDKNNVPKNPKGRTGIAGRGRLPRWGPNHVVLLIIMRGPSLQETLVMNVKTNGSSLNFPTFQGELNPTEDRLFPADFRAQLKEELMKTYHEEDVERIFSKAKKNSLLNYKGYFPDEQNTDNAWTELAVYKIVDELNEHLGLLKFEDPDGKYIWKECDEKTVHRTMKSIIKLAELNINEKVKKGVRMTLWSLKNQGIVGIASLLNDLVNNGLTIGGVVTTAIQMQG